MRVVILSFFSGLVERGVEVYLKDLSKRLKAEFNIQVIDSSQLPARIQPYTNRENPILRRLYLDPTSWAIKQLTKIILVKLERRPPDVLYPLNNGWQSILCKKFCQRQKTKLLLAGHSGPGWDDRINLWLRPDAFLVFSQAQKIWARRITSRVSLHKIPHGVDLSQFKPGKTPISLKLQPPIFVTVSALSPQGRGGETAKNLASTIRSVAKLKKGSLLLIGEGEAAKKLDKLAKSQLGSQRYQRVSVSHNIINRYYQAADVFSLASSSSEAFGLVYLEALASNLPVVTTDDPLRREIVGSAGVFISHPHDIDQYSLALKKALNTNWGSKPRDQAKKYSWDKIIPQYHSLFLKLVAQP